MNRLFVAAWPPPAVVDELAALPRLDHPAIRWTPPQNLHVTLRFCGDVDPESLRDALAGAALPAARALVGPAVATLPGPNPPHVIAPVEGLDDLAAAVRAATGSLIANERRPFRGHVTLARTRHRRDGPQRPPLVGTPIAAEWEVGEIALVASELHPDGAPYQIIDRRPIPAP